MNKGLRQPTFGVDKDKVKGARRTEYLIEFSERLGYFSKETANHLYNLVSEVTKLL